MRFKRIWKRGENAYNWRVNRRARRYITETGGTSQSWIIWFVMIILLICGILGVFT